MKDDVKLAKTKMYKGIPSVVALGCKICHSSSVYYRLNMVIGH